MTNSDLVRKYLRTIGKQRADSMTGQQIHDAIYDECEQSIAISTVHALRQEYTGKTKKPRNRGQFNKYKTTQ